jgi:hypothetical protein
LKYRKFLISNNFITMNKEANDPPNENSRVNYPHTGKASYGENDKDNNTCKEHVTKADAQHFVV